MGIGLFDKACFLISSISLMCLVAMSVSGGGAAPAPTPILPVDMTCVVDRLPVFRWNNRCDAKSYVIELSRDASFKDGVIRVDEITPSAENMINPNNDYAILHTNYRLKESDLPATNGVASTGLRDGVWHWRVGYVVKDGSAGAFCSPRSFEVSSVDNDAIAIPADLRHPYLHFNKEGLSAIKAKLARPECAKFKERLMKTASKALADTASIPSCEELDKPLKDFNRQHGGYLLLADRMRLELEPLGFAYQVTGDRRYAEKAKRRMLALAALDRWSGPYDGYHPKWRSGLETGILCTTYATCYDWIHETLTPDERKALAAGLMKNGLEPLKDWFDPDRYCELPRHEIPYRNWNMVCCGGAGVAALALVAEDDDARRCVRQIRDRMRGWFLYSGKDWAVRDLSASVGKRCEYIEPNFDEDGGYVESLGYFDYGVKKASSYMSVLKNVTREDLYTLIPASAMNPLVYFIYEGGRDGNALSDPKFGDTNVSVFPEELAAIIAARKNDPVAQWLFHKFSPGGEPRNLNTFLEYSSELKPAGPRGDGVKLFHGIGQVVMRDGWGPGRSMLAIKYHQNRGHLDIGTFTLYALGSELIVDTGNCPYPLRRYKDYVGVTPAHNVVMVDGGRQVRDDGKILTFLETPSYGYVCGELRKAYPKELESWRRHVLYLRPGLYVVLDEMRGKGDHRYDWLIHNAGDISVAEDHLTIRNGDAKLLVKLAGQKGLEVDAVKVNFPEDGKSYSYHKLHPPKKAKDFDFTVLLLPYSDDSMLKGVKDLSGPDCRGFEIPGDGATDVVLQSGGGVLHCGRLSGEAKMAAARLPAQGGVAQFMVCEGRNMQVDGKDILRSDAILSGGLSFEERSARGTVSMTCEGELKVAPPFEISEVRVDGLKTDFKVDGGVVALVLPQGTHGLTFKAAVSSR